VTLTPSECKRLIARGVANLEPIKQALKRGRIVLSRSTTNAYVYEELTGRKIDRAKYSCGVITDQGTCINKSVSDRSYQTFVLIDGKPTQLDNPQELSFHVARMKSGDIFVKSANVLDSSGAAATLVGDPTGGEIGQLKSILAKEARLIVPITVSKTIPLSIDKVKDACDIMGTKRSMGMPVSLIPLPGLVITELEALRLLTGAEAVPISTLDAEGRGTVTLSIIGSPEQVNDAWRLLNAIKGEEPITVERNPCSICPATMCDQSGLRAKEPGNC